MSPTRSAREISDQITNTGTVRICLLGPDTRLWCLQKSLLRHHSSYFRALLSPNTLDETINDLEALHPGILSPILSISSSSHRPRFINASVATAAAPFELFVQWIYTGTIDPIPSTPIGASSDIGLDVQRQLNIYIRLFCICADSYFNVPNLASLALTRMHELYHVCRCWEKNSASSLFFTASHVQYIYIHTQPQSLLRQIALQASVYDFLNSSSANFAAAATSSVWDKTSSIYDDNDGDNGTNTNDNENTAEDDDDKARGRQGTTRNSDDNDGHALYSPHQPSYAYMTISVTFSNDLLHAVREYVLSSIHKQTAEKISGPRHPFHTQIETWQDLNQDLNFNHPQYSSPPASAFPSSSSFHVPTTAAKVTAAAAAVTTTTTKSTTSPQRSITPPPPPASAKAPSSSSPLVTAPTPVPAFDSDPLVVSTPKRERKHEHGEREQERGQERERGLGLSSDAYLRERSIIFASPWPSSSILAEKPPPHPPSYQIADSNNNKSTIESKSSNEVQEGSLQREIDEAEDEEAEEERTPNAKSKTKLSVPVTGLLTPDATPTKTKKGMNAARANSVRERVRRRSLGNWVLDDANANAVASTGAEAPILAPAPVMEMEMAVPTKIAPMNVFAKAEHNAQTHSPISMDVAVDAGANPALASTSAFDATPAGTGATNAAAEEPISPSLETNNTQLGTAIATTVAVTGESDDKSQVAPAPASAPIVAMTSPPPPPPPPPPPSSLSTIPKSTSSAALMLLPIPISEPKQQPGVLVSVPVTVPVSDGGTFMRLGTEEQVEEEEEIL